MFLFLSMAFFFVLFLCVSWWKVYENLFNQLYVRGYFGTCLFFVFFSFYFVFCQLFFLMMTNVLIVIRFVSQKISNFCSVYELAESLYPNIVASKLFYIGPSSRSALAWNSAPWNKDSDWRLGGGNHFQDSVQ